MLKKKERKTKIKLSKTQQRKTLMSFYKSLVRAYEDCGSYYYSNGDHEHEDNLWRIANLVGSELGKKPLELPEQDDY